MDIHSMHYFIFHITWFQYKLRPAHDLLYSDVELYNIVSIMAPDQQYILGMIATVMLHTQDYCIEMHNIIHSYMEYHRL